MTELFTALNSRPKYDFSLFNVLNLFIEHQVGTEEIKAFHHFAHVFSGTTFSRVCGNSSILYMHHSEHDFMHFYFTEVVFWQQIRSVYPKSAFRQNLQRASHKTALPLVFHLLSLEYRAEHFSNYRATCLFYTVC